MNVVDTSECLEYFEGGESARKFSTSIKQIEKRVVPTTCIYEISKVILRESDENHLLRALAAIQKGEVVALIPSIATAVQFDATEWTQDVDFKGLPNVNYIPKISKSVVHEY